MFVLVIMFVAYLIAFCRSKHKKRFRKHLLRDFFIGQGILLALFIGFGLNEWFALCTSSFIGFLITFIFGFFFVPVQIFIKIANAIRKSVGGKDIYAEDDFTETSKKAKVEETLPAEQEDRARIIFKFNERYQLRLTDDNVRTIVNGTYYSSLWHTEVEAMRENYNSVVEWYRSGNSCLRLYMKVFNVMEISSDAQFQQNICIESFDKVFTYMVEQNYENVEESIRGINDHFMTNFDDITFMMVYRILQSYGRNYRMPIGSTIIVDSELDEMKRKYEGTPIR